MRLSIFSLLLLIHFCSYGQIHTSTLTKGFIEKAIQYYYNPQTDGQKVKPTFLVLKDTTTNYLRTDYSGFNIDFVSRDEAFDKISKTKKKSGQLDKIATKWLSNDTFDVSIAGWGVSVKRVNQFVNGQRIKYHSYFVASCGGTLGYIPTCRFVYDQAKETWTQLTDREIINQKLARQNVSNN